MPKVKLKSVKRDELKPGLRVVVNELPDTYLYMVKEVSADGFRAELVYYSGAHELKAGVMDYSCLYHPSPEQKRALLDSDGERYHSYLNTCKRANAGALPFDEWPAWHKAK